MPKSFWHLLQRAAYAGSSASTMAVRRFLKGAVSRLREAGYSSAHSSSYIASLLSKSLSRASWLRVVKAVLAGTCGCLSKKGVLGNSKEGLTALLFLSYPSQDLAWGPLKSFLRSASLNPVPCFSMWSANSFNSWTTLGINFSTLSPTKVRRTKRTPLQSSTLVFRLKFRANLGGSLGGGKGLPCIRKAEEALNLFRKNPESIVFSES